MLRNCTLSFAFMLLRWCPGQGSNLHAGITRRGILSPLCLPVSPPGLEAGIVSERNWERWPCSPAGGGGRNRTGVHGFAGRCMTTLPPRRMLETGNSEGFRKQAVPFEDSGAGEESRTPDLNLGKVTLYQLSYSRGQGGILRFAPSAVKPAAISFRARRERELKIVEHRHHGQYRVDVDEPGADVSRAA